MHAASGAAATEAPRGLLYHRYEIDAKGLIVSGRIVTPTAQNQKRMEEDLRQVAEQNAAEVPARLAHLCEQSIRNYDPCISCATHFLKLTVERE
jgi:coenzyme F420-reducing hydrogenase alpha subunit